MHQTTFLNNFHIRIARWPTTGHSSPPTSVKKRTYNLRSYESDRKRRRRKTLSPYQESTRWGHYFRGIKVIARTRKEEKLKRRERERQRDFTRDKEEEEEGGAGRESLSRGRTLSWRVIQYADRYLQLAHRVPAGRQSGAARSGAAPCCCCCCCCSRKCDWREGRCLSSSLSDQRATDRAASPSRSCSAAGHEEMEGEKALRTGRKKGTGRG